MKKILYAFLGLILAVAIGCMGLYFGTFRHHGLQQTVAASPRIVPFEPPISWDFSKSVDPANYGFSKRRQGSDFILFPGHRIANVILPSGRGIKLEVSLVELWQDSGKVLSVELFRPRVGLEYVRSEVQNITAAWGLPGRPSNDDWQAFGSWYQRKKKLPRPDFHDQLGDDWEGLRGVLGNGETVAVEVRSGMDIDSTWSAVWIASWTGEAAASSNK